MRKDMYRAINRYDYQDLDIIGTPSLITRITNDINQIQLAVAMVIRLCSRSPFLIIGSLIMSFVINWQVALIFVIVAPLIAFSIYFVMSHTAPMYSHIQHILDEVSPSQERIFQVSELFVLLTSRIMNKNVLNQQPQSKKKNRSLQVTSVLY